MTTDCWPIRRLLGLAARSWRSKGVVRRRQGRLHSPTMDAVPAGAPVLEPWGRSSRGSSSGSSGDEDHSSDSGSTSEEEHFLREEQGERGRRDAVVGTQADPAIAAMAGKRDDGKTVAVVTRVVRRQQASPARTHSAAAVPTPGAPAKPSEVRSDDTPAFAPQSESGPGPEPEPEPQAEPEPEPEPHAQPQRTAPQEERRRRQLERARARIELNCERVRSSVLKLHKEEDEQRRQERGEQERQQKSNVQSSPRQAAAEPRSPSSSTSATERQLVYARLAAPVLREARNSEAREALHEDWSPPSSRSSRIARTKARPHSAIATPLYQDVAAHRAAAAAHVEGLGVGVGGNELEGSRNHPDWDRLADRASRTNRRRRRLEAQADELTESSHWTPGRHSPGGSGSTGPAQSRAKVKARRFQPAAAAAAAHGTARLSEHEAEKGVDEDVAGPVASCSSTSSTDSTHANVFAKLTDTATYTGTHKHRFDATGRGISIGNQWQVGSICSDDGVTVHDLSQITSKTVRLTGAGTFQALAAPQSTAGSALARWADPAMNTRSWAFGRWVWWVDEVMAWQRRHPRLAAVTARKRSSCGYRPAVPTVFSKLTDASAYTGTHKHRFDASTGRGKGLAGRGAPSHSGCFVSL
jgi:hypothetical protein